MLHTIMKYLKILNNSNIITILTGTDSSRFFGDGPLINKQNQYLIWKNSYNLIKVWDLLENRSIEKNI